MCFISTHQEYCILGSIVSLQLISFFFKGCRISFIYRWGELRRKIIWDINSDGERKQELISYWRSMNKVCCVFISAKIRDITLNILLFTFSVGANCLADRTSFVSASNARKQEGKFPTVQQILCLLLFSAGFNCAHYSIPTIFHFTFYRVCFVLRKMLLSQK